MTDAINPEHYKSHLRIPANRIQEFIDPESGDLVLQWMDKIEFTLSPEEFRGVCLAMGDKYLSRLGKKDKPSQETGKAGWYIERLTKWFKDNGQ